jgi:hypothetical protein
MGTLFRRQNGGSRQVSADDFTLGSDEAGAFWFRPES